MSDLDKNEKNSRRIIVALVITSPENIKKCIFFIGSRFVPLIKCRLFLVLAKYREKRHLFFILHRIFNNFLFRLFHVIPQKNAEPVTNINIPLNYDSKFEIFTIKNVRKLRNIFKFFKFSTTVDVTFLQSFQLRQRLANNEARIKSINQKRMTVYCRQKTLWAQSNIRLAKITVRVSGILIPP